MFIHIFTTFSTLAPRRLAVGGAHESLPLYGLNNAGA